MANNLNKDKRLMKEILFLAIPRSPRLDHSNDVTSQLQAAYLPTAIDKICSNSLLLEPGWSRLPSLRRIVKKLPGEIKFTMNEFYLNNSTRTLKVADAFQSGQKLVGLVGLSASTILHAVTFVKIENGQYVFKNSYGESQNIVHPDPLKKPIINISVSQQAWTPSRARNGLSHVKTSSM